MVKQAVLDPAIHWSKDGGEKSPTQSRDHAGFPLIFNQNLRL